ncbi:DNA-binding winged helix-turn-helix (wHTH) protein/pimeloyl-ACP methyl ester carboxylesterase [Bradyrhizobium sp. CIR18]|uniref:alpha/beta fold hydrolase n=1 Tax=Bradyrhizobium sp. CIR18 TaxID=2663839 RepID=UPI0018547326|nr:alpha/beta fold hydrolase [Bradyrhizobium sp. CIR18]MBB4363506.1 DNA-binding winged helix-turn-helix (wHTH) protein/pimeloyl-ACP methyl ester carboxylesterase [Bradyrhizobium sp. CIR18]
MVRFGRFLLDTERRELSREGVRVQLGSRAMDILCELASAKGNVVSKDHLLERVWPGLSVEDSNIHVHISALRKALEDGAREQSFVITVPGRGYRLIGLQTMSGGNEGEPKRFDADPSQISQEIKYCRTSEGVRLAYAIAGSGHPLVKTANWLNHLEYDWQTPVWQHVVHGLARKHTLIRYDARGTGMSDWDVETLSLEAWVSDLETVVNAVGIDRFPLLGVSQGCAVSIAYAVTHPERVSHLILYGGFALGAAKRSPEQRELRAAMATLMRHGWGSDNPAFRQLFTGQFMPGATPEQAAFFNELQRRTTSPECAARYLAAAGEIDVTEVLGKVTMPTLVMHARGDARVPFELGRSMAAGIPGARFIPLQGQNHLFLEHEAASERFFEEVEFFLKR